MKQLHVKLSTKFIDTKTFEKQEMMSLSLLTLHRSHSQSLESNTVASTGTAAAFKHSVNYLVDNELRYRVGSLK